MTVESLLTQAVADQIGMSLQELEWRVDELRQSGVTDDQIVAWLSYYDPSNIVPEGEG